MLLGNFNIFNNNPGRCVGGVTDPTYWTKAGGMANKFVSEAYIEDQTERTGLYHGYLHPYSYGLPYYAGGMASTYSSDGNGTVNSSNLAGGLNAVSTLDGLGTISNANAYLLVSISSIILNDSSLTGQPFATLSLASIIENSSDLSGSVKGLSNIVASILANGDVSGDVTGALNFNASISASGLIDNAIGKLVAAISSSLDGTANVLNNNVILALEATANVAGNGNTTASIKALGNLLSNVLGNGNIDSAASTALAKIAADITPFTELSPQNIAVNVWNALASQFTENGTMGELLSSVGSVGDPWITTLPGTYDNDQAGAILNKILNISKYLQVN